MIGNAYIFVWFNHTGLSGKYPAILTTLTTSPVTWPWCNLVASQMIYYCASMNSHSPVGLVSRQWGAFDWACVQCDCCIHNDWANRSASSQWYACTFYSSCEGFFLAKHHITQVYQPPTTQIWLPAASVFSQAKITIESEVICECDGHTVHKLSQWCLTANWLAPRESDCSWMHSKVFSDCQVTSRPRDHFSRYSKWLDTFRTGLIW